MSADPALSPAETWTDDELQRNLSRVVKALTKLRELTADDVADAARIPRSTYYNKLRTGKFTAAEVARVANALRVSPGTLYTPAEDLLPRIGYKSLTAVRGRKRRADRQRPLNLGQLASVTP